MERSGLEYRKEKLVQEVLEHRFEQPKHVLAICSEILDLTILDNDSSRIMIYTNLATCCMLCGDLEKARHYIDRMEAQCSVHFCDMDQVYVGCMKTRYYHLCGDFQKQDAMIEAILQRQDAMFLLMDVFDELYYICELSLEIKRYDVFWKLADGLDSVVVENKMFDLERRLLELKITYYRANGSQKQYNTALQRFFELHTILETESKSMVSSMLRIRSNMEHLRERKEQMEELNAVLAERVGTDPLTGIANRYLMTEYLQKELDNCMQHKKFLSIEILDIDFFKEYNDNYGHQEGDECIRKVASILKNMQNDNVFCVRYGGDEFIIIYNGIDSAQVYEMANEIREQIKELQIVHEYSKADFVITISQGICQDIPKAENRSWDFLTVADNYLYQVKRKERNNICVGNFHGNFRFYQ